MSGNGDGHDRFFKASRGERSVKHAPYHSPCPTCYRDVSPHSRSDIATGGIVFECVVHGVFLTTRAAARRHTGWLLTRNAVQVQIATRTNQNQGAS